MKKTSNSSLGHNPNSLICSTSEEEMRNLYLIEKKTAPQIAKIYNCSTDQAKTRLNRFKIRKTAVDKCKSGKGHLLTKENLERMYKTHNIDQIAEIIGISSPAVRGHFLRKGIPIDKKHSIALRRVHIDPNNVILKCRKFTKRVFYHSNNSIITRAKKSVGAAKREERKNKMNKTEKKAKSILDHLGISYDSQKYVGLMNQALEWGICADFIIKSLPLKTVVCIDSRYHHNKEENIIHDLRTNYRLMQNGYLVIRLWNDEICMSRIVAMIHKAYSAKKPALLCYRYPDKYRRYCPKEYLRANTKISNTPFEALYGFYYNNCYIPCP